jgi:hypothetical protein
MLELYWVETLKSLRGMGHKTGQPLSEEDVESMRNHALHVLKKITGQDFGFDVEAWEKFLTENPDIYVERLKRGEIPGRTYSKEDFDNYTI